MLDSYCLDFFYIFLGIFILVYLAIFEYCTYVTNKPTYSRQAQTMGSYGYGECDGPHSWKEKFPNACGENQSPVNLQSSCAIVVHVETLLNPLEFSRDYRSPPSELILVNDGHTINLYPEYKGCSIPKICGGPLDGVYELHCLNLRWGPNDEEGTEHMINNKRFALELQVTFLRAGHRNKFIAADAGDAIMVAYIYQTTPIANPYLNIILEQLGPASESFKRYEIETIPVSLLAPCFSRGYFSYVGSLTHPPCIEGVRWIVHPEPLSISCCQMKKLRKTHMLYCDLKNNTRPVQELNSREVIFYD
ncbi:carbonic anhydrase 13-like isoform X1 [Coccinella septempunctata]|uniref:carbonic anhydrase 13-like isoform X1 n=1 Tax=Coccinella septempunctata TaxID=41139 RepID=UPI001D083102|nr:carbonic anhydrase 13-like isoform X1 [Coccinella septempunctata]